MHVSKHQFIHPYHGLFHNFKFAIMKNILFLFVIIGFLSFGFMSDDVIKSKQIQVTYMNYSDNGNYKTRDCFSNDMCTYQYRLLEYDFTVVVDFDKEQITSKSMFYKEYSDANTNAIKKSFSYQKKLMESDTLYANDFTRVDTKKEKTICGVECKNMILRRDTNSYDVWYFKPRKIKKNKLYAYTYHTNFESVPGIVLEVSHNGVLVSQAISLSSNCDR